jgi:DNA polymerase-3 subunit delta
MLFKTALDELLSALVPGAERTRNYEPIDGDNQNISDAVDRVNTFSLFSGKKVVGLCDSQVFQSKQDTNQILEKAKQAFESDNIKKASGYLLRALGILNLSFEDITEQSLNKALNIEVSRKDAEWIMSLLDYCREKKLKVPGKGDGETAVLQEAIEKGFPKGNYLIITTETVDKRRALYKAIKENGVIIDCAVPKGDRKADKIEQGKVLNERKNAILKRNNKSMSNDAYLAMVQMAGFDLRTFVNNLEKLISFTGDRKDITVNDVRSVLQRTKQDPIYEFTNAITDRSLAKSLFYMHSLLKGPDIGHPLQLLGGIINQIRKHQNVKRFMKST